jgi:hypothetical protein
MKVMGSSPFFDVAEGGAASEAACCFLGWRALLHCYIATFAGYIADVAENPGK